MRGCFFALFCGRGDGGGGRQMAIGIRGLSGNNPQMAGVSAVNADDKDELS